MTSPNDIRSLAFDESGATLVEYSLVVGLISLVCLAALSFLGGKISTLFSTVGNSVAGA
jgi:pilus assembly protein Flp/PilA